MNLQDILPMYKLKRNINRSREKYPDTYRMLDALIGELEELKSAYHDDGDIESEALDVAAVAFRIASEGDKGGNKNV